MQSIEWRPVLGYEGLYEVSNTGWVRRIAPGPNAALGRLLKQANNPNGYYGVGLHKAGRQSNHYVHRLVAAAFHGPCPDGRIVRHLDGDRTNNDASNLRWGTYSENVQDSIRHGTKYMEPRRTHCANGHEFSEENTYLHSPGHRGCRTCHRQSGRDYLARKKQREAGDE